MSNESDFVNQDDSDSGEDYFSGNESDSNDSWISFARSTSSPDSEQNYEAEICSSHSSWSIGH